MIEPEEIIEKAERLYPKAVTAILSGVNDFFPHRLACNLKPPADHADLIASVGRLRMNSKASLGYGYSVSYQPRRSHDHGANDFPEAIFIESMDDLVRLVRKSTEFNKLSKAVEFLRAGLPELETWIRCNWRKLIAASDDIPALVEVTRWLKLHPRPGCFPRELPLPISSKLVESYWAVLTAWWDIVLPHETLDYGCDPKNYAQRYGFRSVQTHVLVRLLDAGLQQTLHVPFSEFSVPTNELSTWIDCKLLKTVVLVENKINLLTFPRLPCSIALGGLGFGVSMLRQVAWLSEVDVYYWGDLDVEGFQILSALRSFLPQSRSWLMDQETLLKHLSLSVPGNGAVLDWPLHLTAQERETFRYCRDHNLRLEQERIPQAYVIEQAVKSF